MIELTGKVVDKSFRSVTYKDKKTQEEKTSRAGDLVLEVDNSYVTKQGEQKTIIDLIPVNFFGTRAEEAEGVPTGSQVTTQVQISGRKWQDKYYPQIKGLKFTVLDRVEESIPF